MKKKTLQQLALEGDYAFPAYLFPTEEAFLAQGFFQRHPEFVEQAKLELKAERELLN